MDTRFWRTALATILGSTAVCIVGGAILFAIVAVHFRLSTSDQERAWAVAFTALAMVLVVGVVGLMVGAAVLINTRAGVSGWPAAALTGILGLAMIFYAGAALEFSNVCGPGHHVLSLGERETGTCFP